MGRDQATTPSHLGSAAKENLPPKMGRRTVSLSNLFNQTDRLRKQNERAARDVHAPRPAGILKPTVPAARTFAQFRKPKDQEHPVYTRFKEAASEYKQEAFAAESERLQSIYDTLIARVDGKDVNGQPLNTPGVPTEADINALMATDHELSRPLEDDILNAKRKRTGEVEEVRLGDTLRTYEVTAEGKRAEIDDLFEQLKAVNAEIAAAQRDVVHAENMQVKKAKKELDAQLDAFKDEAARIKQQTLDECKKAQKEDKNAKKLFQSKIDALYDEM